jgi:hypothetical protein
VVVPPLPPTFAPAKAAPPEPPSLLKYSDAVLARLASEAARNIYPLRQILQEHAIDVEYFREVIAKHPQFQRLYVEARQIWTSSTGAADRVSAKSAALIEQWLEEANRLFHDQAQPLSSKVALMAMLAKMAKVDGTPEKSGKGGDDQRVVVNINLSAAGAPPVIIDKAGMAKPVEAAVVSS